MADLGGLNPHHAVAGLGGGLAALPFLTPANKIAALGCVVCGLVTAMYLTPMVSEGLFRFSVINAPLSTKAELGLAFIMGLTAMTTIPFILGIANWLKNNVSKIMGRIVGQKTDGGDL